MSETAEKPNSASEDYLGYRVYAQTLWARIARALEKDGHGQKELGDDPLVVGIFGEWGAGKSKLLSLMLAQAQAVSDERIANHKNISGYAPLTVPVFFQPWKYEHEKHLLVPMLLHILLALEETLKRAKTFDDKLVGAVHKGVEAAVSGVGGLVGAAKKVMGVVDPASAAALATAEALASYLPEKRQKVAQANHFTFKEDGRSYYEMHRIFQKITRPGKYPEVAGNQFQDKDFAANFVIFIDDLDRCLPEKAVEALELIKTVFNLESFAFVLALDEEVIERGIGHRYKDYSFQGKKPEMPITGFEYLEKIVHLPFRLPALTREQAYRFLVHYEKDNLLPAYKTSQYEPQQWMIPIEVFSYSVGVNVGDGRSALLEAIGAKGRHLDSDGSSVETPVRTMNLNLASLILESYTAYVPRKLIRALELFHHVLRVLHEDGRIGQVKVGDELDPRLLLTMAMLQLFQPELYRGLRREQGAFLTFWAAFEKHKPQSKVGGATVGPNRVLPSIIDEDEGKSELLPGGIGDLRRAKRSPFHSRISDADIMHWAVFYLGDKPPIDLDTAYKAAAQLPEWRERYESQRLRLPVTTLLLAHRSMGRLAFDPLALMQVLYESHSLVGLGSVARGFAALSQVLDETQDEIKLSKANSGRRLIEVVRTVAQSASKAIPPWRSARRQSAVSDVNALFVMLLSEQASVQKEAAASAGLQDGQCLQVDSASRLLELLKTEKASQEKAENAAWKQRFMRGLQVIAPHVPDELAQGFWDLAKDDPSKDNFGKTFETLDSLHATERWADLRSTLGQDDRFDPQFYYLPKTQEGDGIANIPGFVRVADKTLGEYFMARCLTTVDQYAYFIQDKGYEEKKFWDDLGWLWRTGEWDSQVQDKAYKNHLARRSKDLRHQPMGWSEQLAHGSRPVMRLNWFEARAYCKWLSLQPGLENHRAHLPTEAQWQRAAQAKDSNQADQREYPWGNEEGDVHLRANIYDSKIGRASVVGHFKPSAIGIFDLSGNLWEWQGNFYQGDEKSQTKALPENVSSLKTHEDLEKCDRPALRGGSWRRTADGARASVRLGNLPDFWDLSVGFRVVLSLA